MAIQGRDAARTERVAAGVRAGGGNAIVTLADLY
jgi:hypothetical protein